MNDLQRLARSLKLDGDGRPWSYDRLLDRCAALYWQKRPTVDRRCGTHTGYEAHRARGEKPCYLCRTSESRRRMLRAEAARRGVRRLPRQLQPCGTHSAFVRHRARGEDVDDACRQAERTYQRNRSRPRQQDGRAA